MNLAREFELDFSVTQPMVARPSRLRGPRDLPVAVAVAAAPRTAALELRDVCKGYGSGAARSEVLSQLNLRIEAGEFVAVIGFSGSGKTTLVKLLAGLIRADSGAVLKDGEPVTAPGPDRGIVFQSNALMPWLTVRENVALAVDRVFALDSAADRAARVMRVIGRVGLVPVADKKPPQLSGGMRQRASVARALAADPDVLLLDEPLGALDALTRARLQDEIVGIWNADTDERKGGQRRAVLLITDDVDEALMMADRIVVLETGPRAKPGPAYAVDIERPRDRRGMNHDRRFQSLRAEITQHLLGLAHMRDAGQGAVVIPLPTLVPADVSNAKRPTAASRFGLRHAALAESIERESKSPPALPGGAAPRANDARFVDFSNVVKTCPGTTSATGGNGSWTVVDGFDLQMKRGEFVSIIGHPGCGKSTVLSMAAGLTEITEGVIVLDNREVADAGSDRSLVLQAPSLVPRLSAYDNVMLGVVRVFPHASKEERHNTVAYHLGRVGLGSAMHKRAADLSSGMQQRVSIARAFARSPKLLLLDEPFGRLDSLTRWDLQQVLMEVWTRSRITTVMVTHDVDEAMLLADRVVMMTNGPRAKIGLVMKVPLPRPRTRETLLAHPRYYALREALIGFLEDGANPRRPGC